MYVEEVLGPRWKTRKRLTMRLRILCLMLVSSIWAIAHAKGRVVCYLASWSLYRTGNDVYKIEDINSSLCTHIIYAFANLYGDGTIKVGDSYTDSSSGQNGYNRLNALKKVNTNLKTLIAIGGGSAGSTNFSKVFNSASLRAAFVDNAANFVRQNGFNGLDVDWEFPGDGTGSQTSDKVAFTTTLAALRTKFTPLGLLLSAACPSPSYYIRVSYNVSSISQSLDFINLMTYDFHNGYQSTTGLNAPLYVRKADSDKELNVVAGVNNWLNNGAPANKINVGMGFYGTAFSLKDASKNGVGAASSGPGGSDGAMEYYKICKSQYDDDGWNLNWDDEADVPFGNLGKLWVGYDDPDSIAEKAQYVVSNQLGGAMVWSMDQDDYKGYCGEKNILLKSINNNLS
uniref:GH18 domain-containing protein n=1 Tax=Timema poppense TaxID=170557 RepID=A0A7R9CMH3_TIMPO|nr:unnamed protein product [Timema poppensis]